MPEHVAMLLSSGEPVWPAIRAALHAVPARIAGEATTAADAVRVATEYQPDLILASTRLNGESSLPVLAELQRIHLPQSNIVVIAAAELDQIELMEFGQLHLSGLLTWQKIPTLESIERVLAAAATGSVTIGTWSVARSYFFACHGQPIPGQTAIELTEREKRILKLRAQQRTYTEIARAEAMSQRVVERTVASLRDKLDAPDQFTLGMNATLLGLVP